MLFKSTLVVFCLDVIASLVTGVFFYLNPSQTILLYLFIGLSALGLISGIALLFIKPRHGATSKINKNKEEKNKEEKNNLLKSESKVIDQAGVQNRDQRVVGVEESKGRKQGFESESKPAVDQLKLNQDLFKKVKEGDFGSVQQLIVHGADVNARDSLKCTPLHEAVRQGNKNTIWLLVQAGADVNAQNRFKRTPLHVAVRQGNKTTIGLLVRARADVNARNRLKRIPLHEAVNRGHDGLVKDLLEAKSLVNAKDALGDTALLVLAKNQRGLSDVERNAMLEQLLKKGARPKIKNNDGQTALSLLLTQNKYGMAMKVAFHLSDNDLIAFKKAHSKVLLSKIRRSDSQFLPLLQVLKTKRPNGSTPFHFLVTKGKLQWLTRLCKLNLIDVNAKNNSGDSALLVLAKSQLGHSDAVMQSMLVCLLDNGADPDLVNNDGQTALGYFMQQEQYIMAKIVASRMAGKSLDRFIIKGKYTALIEAAGKRQSNLIKVLLARGANPNIKDGDPILGATALMWAISSGSTEAARLLLDCTDLSLKNCAGRTALHEMIHFGRLELLKAVIHRKGLDPDVRDNDGNTALLLLAKNEEGDFAQKIGSMLQLLIQNGANPNLKNKKHETLLYILMRKKQYGMVRVVLASIGALEVDSGELFVALSLGQADLVKELITKGGSTSINDKNSKGKTLLRLAMEQNNRDLVSFLVKNGANIDLKGRDSSGDTFAHTLIRQDHFVAYQDYLFGSLQSQQVEIASIRSSNGNTLLHLAVQLGKTAVVTRLCEVNSSMANSKNNSGETPLLVLAKFAGHPLNDGIVDSILKELCAVHAIDLDLRDDKDQTALLWFLSRKKVKWATMVAKKMTDFEACGTPDKSTALITAVKLTSKQEGVEGLVRLLIDGEANIDAQDKSGNSPLILALKRRDSVLAKHFLDADADVTIANRRKETALHLEASAEVVQLLIKKGAGVNARDIEGNTPLFTVLKPYDDGVYYSSAECAKSIEYLLAAGADVTIENKRKETALHLVKSGKVAQLLIKKGADINAKDQKGNRPLILALKKRDTALAKCLLNAGADVTIANSRQATPLHLVESAEVQQLLIEKGADINARDDEGNTPILISVMGKGDSGLVSGLSEAGADFRIANNLGRTLFHFLSPLFHYLEQDASEEEGPGLLSKISQKLSKEADVNAQDVEGNTPLFTVLKPYDDGHGHFSFAKCVKSIKYLLGAGADVRIQNKLGQTLLHLVSSYHSFGGEQDLESMPELVKLLIEKGADINQRDAEGNTPLLAALQTYEAAVRGRINTSQIYSQSFPYIIRCLLNAGADVTIANNRQQTFLNLFLEIYGAKGVQDLESIAELVKLLIEKGADINQRDAEGNTPLLAALQTYEAEVGRRLNNTYPTYSNFTYPTYSNFHQSFPYIIQCLLNAGADVTIANNRQQTFLILFLEIFGVKLFEQGLRIKKEEFKGFIYKLLYRGATIISPFYLNCSEEMAAFLLTAMAKVGVSMRRGEGDDGLSVFLSRAVEHENPHFLLALLQHGVILKKQSADWLHQYIEEKMLQLFLHGFEQDTGLENLDEILLHLQQDFNVQLGFDIGQANILDILSALAAQGHDITTMSHGRMIDMFNQVLAELDKQRDDLEKMDLKLIGGEGGVKQVRIDGQNRCLVLPGEHRIPLESIPERLQRDFFGDPLHSWSFRPKANDLLDKKAGRLGSKAKEAKRLQPKAFTLPLVPVKKCDKPFLMVHTLLKIHKGKNVPNGQKVGTVKNVSNAPKVDTDKNVPNGQKVGTVKNVSNGQKVVPLYSKVCGNIWITISKFLKSNDLYAFRGIDKFSSSIFVGIAMPIHACYRLKVVDGGYPATSLAEIMGGAQNAALAGSGSQNSASSGGDVNGSGSQKSASSGGDVAGPGSQKSASSGSGVANRGELDSLLVLLKGC